MEIKYCTKCFYPETKPDLHFDEKGVCSACIGAEHKNLEIDWKQREKDFYEIINKIKLPPNKIGYDCLIPVSGGKDSTYQAYFMKYVCGLNPLLVCFETTAITEIGQGNLDNLCEMGMDLIHFKKNHQVYRKMVIEGFKRVGDEMWPNHVGIFTIPTLIALKFGIKLVVWGENPELEYGGPLETFQNNVINRKWLEEFGGLLGYRIQDMVGVDDITEKELTPYFYPSNEEIENLGVMGIFLGHYFFWDARKQLEIVKRYGFKIKEDGPVEGTYTNYENLDDKLVGLHDYLKYVKYGFGRTTDHVCIDIRNKRLTRTKGLELIQKYDGKYPHKAIADFITYSGLTKDEIDSVIDSYTNALIFKKNPDGTFPRQTDGSLIRNFEIK